MAEQRREYFRVEYPIVERPVFSITTGKFDVIDVSEFGVRFNVSVAHDFVPGQMIAGKIRFGDGRAYDCMGEVVRVDDYSVSMYLHTPIPMLRIQKETVHLMMSYYGVPRKEEAGE